MLMRAAFVAANASCLCVPGPMEEDEFLRKFHPVIGLWNILSANPNMEVKCPTELGKAAVYTRLCGSSWCIFCSVSVMQQN
jgi:hypothetical protein